MPLAQEIDLELPELFTTILLNLDISTLLLAQRVPNSLYQLITSAPTLQQALFLISDPKATPALNPLHVAYFPIWFLTVSEWYLTPESLRKLKWSCNEEKVKKMCGCGTASWKRMLAVQPAADGIAIDAQTCRKGGDWSGEAKIVVRRGVRMGMLYDYVLRGLDELRRRFKFRFDWRGGAGGAEKGEGEMDGENNVGEAGRERQGTVKLITITMVTCIMKPPSEILQRLKRKGYRDWPIKWKTTEKRRVSNLALRGRSNYTATGSGEWEVDRRTEG